MNEKLKRIINVYFDKHDDYFEAKDALIFDINEILENRDEEDLGVICNNRLNDLATEFKNMFNIN